MTGYKVLLNREGRMFSPINTCGGRVQYEENLWAEPLTGFGPLTVFDNPADAVELQRHLELPYGCRVPDFWYSVRMVEYEPSDQDRVWTVHPEYLQPAEYSSMYVWDLREGTRLAARVRVLALEQERREEVKLDLKTKQRRQ